MSSLIETSEDLSKEQMLTAEEMGIYHTHLGEGAVQDIASLEDHEADELKPGGVHSDHYARATTIFDVQVCLPVCR